MFSKIMLIYMTAKKLYQIKKKTDEIRSKVPKYILGTFITVIFTINSCLLYYTAKFAVKSCEPIDLKEE